ncbi:MAG TPA: hypothetical protein VK063_05910 [Beutenbergiaceae bacterium]|nr:hypothetical protein [Beutenbergiaceae bacterium]
MTNLLAAQHEQVALEPELSDGLVADAEAFMAESQRHLQARLQEVEERFARFRHPNLRPRNARP